MVKGREWRTERDHEVLGEWQRASPIYGFQQLYAPQSTHRTPRAAVCRASQAGSGSNRRSDMPRLLACDGETVVHVEASDTRPERPVSSSGATSTVRLHRCVGNTRLFSEVILSPPVLALALCGEILALGCAADDAERGSRIVLWRLPARRTERPATIQQMECAGEVLTSLAWAGSDGSTLLSGGYVSGYASDMEGRLTVWGRSVSSRSRAGQAVLDRSNVPARSVDNYVPSEHVLDEMSQRAYGPLAAAKVHDASSGPPIQLLAASRRYAFTCGGRPAEASADFRTMGGLGTSQGARTIGASAGADARCFIWRWRVIEHVVPGEDETVLPAASALSYLDALCGHASPVTALATSAQGELLVSCSGAEDSPLRIWDTETGKCLRAVDYFASVRMLPWYEAHTAARARGGDLGDSASGTKLDVTASAPPKSPSRTFEDGLERLLAGCEAGYDDSDEAEMAITDDEDAPDASRDEACARNEREAVEGAMAARSEPLIEEALLRGMRLGEADAIRGDAARGAQSAAACATDAHMLTAVALSGAMLVTTDTAGLVVLWSLEVASSPVIIASLPPEDDDGSNLAQYIDRVGIVGNRRLDISGDGIITTTCRGAVTLIKPIGRNALSSLIPE